MTKIDQKLECSRCGKHFGYFWLGNPEEASLFVTCIDCGRRDLHDEDISNFSLV